ncbi:MAG: ATP-binding protein [Bacteroidota bacterium]
MNSPFKFLDAYSREDKDIFFGRSKETEDLYEEVFKTNLLLLYGASGTGKTSLINCGLGNKFADTDWYAISIRRLSNLVNSLQRAIQTHAETPIESGTPIRQAIHSLYLDTYLPIYLIFDQFEELFILGDEAEQEQFFYQLSEILQTGLQCKVILSMREEYLAHLSDYEKIVPSLFDHRYRIERMSFSNLKEVISQTTDSFAIRLEPMEETIDLILQQLQDKREGIDLTHLQVYLDRLYRQDMKRQGISPSENAITFDPDLIGSVGKVENVLAEFLEEQLAEIDQALGKQDVALAVLFVFVSEDGTNQHIHRSYVEDYLMKTKGITAEEIDYCLQQFAEKRILKPVIIDEDE